MTVKKLVTLDLIYFGTFVASMIRGASTFCVLTLFIVKRLTGRTDWETVFGSKKKLAG